MMKISVILPVHSEKESLTQLTDTLVPLLHGTLHEIIIIVSPISPPDTIRIADDLAVRYDCLTVQTQRKYPGLGRAIRQGISAASGTHLLFMDTDGEKIGRAHV